MVYLEFVLKPEWAEVHDIAGTQMKGGCVAVSIVEGDSQNTTATWWNCVRAVPSNYWQQLALHIEVSVDEVV